MSSTSFVAVAQTKLREDVSRSAERGAPQFGINVISNAALLFLPLPVPSIVAQAILHSARGLLGLGELIVGLQRTSTLGLEAVANQRQLRSPACANAAPDCPLVPLWLVADDIGDDLRAPLERRLPWKTVERHSLGSFRAAPFQSKAVLRMQPHLGLLSCFDPAPRWTLQHDCSDHGRGLLVVRPSDGMITVEQSGRRQTCAQREAIILDAGTLASFTMSGVSRIDCLVVSGAPDGAATGMQHIAHDNGGLVALGHYAAAVMRGLLPMNSAALTALAIDYMNGLVATMIAEANGPLRTAAPLQDRLGLSLLSIKADIEARLGQATLSLDRLAAAHGVTARYFQKLFEAEGRTFSDYLLERRLERAVHMLRDRNRVNRAVSSIAFDVGFGDLSYFNRTFKKRFGATPREIRARFEAMVDGNSDKRAD